jgi:hypothetical protein
MGALPAYGKPAPVAQAAIGTEIHQALYIHGNLAPEIALDPIFLVDRITDTRRSNGISTFWQIVLALVLPIPKI